MIITVAGLDPALSNLGMASGTYNLHTGEFTLEKIGLVETASSKTKSVRKNCDDLNRAIKLHSGMMEFIAKANIVFVETPVGSQSARAMCSYGVCVGLLATIKTPLIQVTAKEVKSSSGNPDASKKDMITWASENYPDVPWLTKLIKGNKSLVNKNEHIADAVGAILAGLKTEDFQKSVAIATLTKQE